MSTWTNKEAVLAWSLAVAVNAIVVCGEINPKVEPALPTDAADILRMMRAGAEMYLGIYEERGDELRVAQMRVVLAKLAAEGLPPVPEEV